ncbi:unnamed protein product [Toxocara canis]|uniref:ADAMTS-like protein 2 n=1 Tax=Toxocara canis TaxID=6265 RepID=A0A183U8R7_TOXCA|nr:unnamed protein product [Toxocara canis]
MLDYIRFDKGDYIKVDVWSQCSSSCGAGEQRREVTCEQRSADGELRVFNPPNECRHLEKPPTVQLCNLGNHLYF